MTTNGPRFADIFLKTEIKANNNEPISLAVDIEYSRDTEISMIRTINGIQNRLKEQIKLFLEAPDTVKTYFVEKYTNGTVCAVN